MKNNGGSNIPDVVALGRICEAMPDWWAITPKTIDELSYALLGKRGSGRWLRRGSERAIIAKKKFGAEAATLTDEFYELSRQAKRILSDGTHGSALRAVAFYHLRFENIHPLHDGNGRIGRIILSGQIYQSCGYSPALLKPELKKRVQDYKAAFRATTACESYAQLLVLLCQILKIRTDSVELDSSFSLEPLHQSPGMPMVT